MVKSTHLEYINLVTRQTNLSVITFYFFSIYWYYSICYTQRVSRCSPMTSTANTLQLEIL